MSWKQTLRNDDRTKTFAAQFLKTWAPILDVSALNKEIESLHLSRKTKDLRLGAEKVIKSLIETNIQDMGNRSRLCHIKLQINDVSAPLTQHRDALIDYLSTTYQEDLNAEGFRGKASKVEAIMSLKLMVQVQVLLTDLQTLWDNCDIVVNDIDQAGFALKRIQEALSLQAQRGNTI